MVRPGSMVGLMVAVGVSGCTSVRVAQRDGCWVRHSERWLGGAREELGPCAPATPTWSDDRLTRLAQECVARADYRHYLAALAAWDAGRPAPQRASDDTVLKACMDESTRVVLTENEAMKKRLTELAADRDALKVEDERARTHLYTTDAKLAEYLGDAAKKAQAPASATATASSDSSGSASTESAHEDHTSLASQPGAPTQQRVVVTTAPAGKEDAAAPRKRKARAVRAQSPACPAPEPGPGPAASANPTASETTASAPHPDPLPTSSARGERE